MEPWLVASLLVLGVAAAAALGIARMLRGRDQRIAEAERRNDALERLAEAQQPGRQRLFDSGPVVMLELDAEPPHGLRDASASLQLARGGLAAPTGRPLAELLHPDDAAPLTAAIEQARRQPGERVQREVRLWHEGGQWRWQLLQLVADAGRDDDGGGRLVRGYLVGIDAIKQAEGQAAARRRDLEELVQKMSASQRFLQTLQLLSEHLQRCNDEGEAGVVVSRAGPELFARWDGLLSFADGQGRMTQAARWGEFPELPSAGNGPREGDCWALRRGRLHRTSATGSVRERGPVCAHLGADGMGSLPQGVQHSICTPVVTPGGRPGALHLVTREPLDGEQVRAAGWAAESVADLLRLSLANLQLRISLREQAVRDWLTGLYNRRHFEDVLRGELARAERNRDVVTLALLDIDHFKQFNDLFGHEAGDEVLKAVAAELRSFVRAYDTACRIGGEELALLLPRAPIEECRIRLDTLRRRIGALALAYDDVALPAITVSIGIADTRHGSSSDLLHRADVALYAAKHGGRDRVACWDAELDGGGGMPALQSAGAEANAVQRVRRRDVA